MIYYYNNTPIGVVFYDDTIIKIIALKDIDKTGSESAATGITWLGTSSSNYKYNVPGITDISNEGDAIADMNGKNNTSALIAFSKSDGHMVGAALATYLYAPSVCASGSMCGAGEWYLPALGELQKIYDNLDTIQSTLSSSGGAPLATDNYYWSSSEYSNDISAWNLSFYSGLIYAGYKYINIYVRPCLEIAK